MSCQARAVSASPPPITYCKQLTFQGAQLQLLAHVRSRIRNGELTERGLPGRLAFLNRMRITRSRA